MSKNPMHDQMPKYLGQEFPYLNNVCADIRLLGMPAILCPFIQHTSSSRAEMFNSHSSQAEILNTAQFPQIFSGMEYEMGQYEYDSTRRDQDAQILAIIPRYTVANEISGIKENPSWLIIYLGLDDRKVHYITLDTYSSEKDGFGWKNTWQNINGLSSGAHLSKETVLQTHPGWDGTRWKLGTNLRVAYMTHPATNEDAMVISRTAAEKKLTRTQYHRRVINVPEGSIPVNRYGTDEDPKFLPDIGERVADDGILCAFRRVSTTTFVADTNKAALRRRQMHDETFSAPAGAKIINTEVYLSAFADKIDPMFAQMEKYHQGTMQYYRTILEVYHRYCSASSAERYTPSRAFNTLVTRALEQRLAMGITDNFGIVQRQKNSRIPLMGRTSEGEIQFARIIVTYVMDRVVNLGHKMSDRYGTKGVISDRVGQKKTITVEGQRFEIWEDDDMPTDDMGFRAEVIIDPGSIPQRMNPGHPHEQGICRAAEIVRRALEKIYPIDRDRAVAMLREFLADINPNYSNLIFTQVKTTPEQQYAYVEECIRDRIYIHIPPFLNTTTGFVDKHGNHYPVPDVPAEVLEDEELLDTYLKEHGLRPALEVLFEKFRVKWGYKETPVTFTTRDEHGNAKTDRTQHNVCIGDKYMYVLGKIPDPISPGFARISHVGIPVKTPPRDRAKSPVSMNPVRIVGEDESRVIGADLGPHRDELFRLMSLQANSLVGVQQSVRQILRAENPVNIPRIGISNAELSDTNITTGLFHHMMATVGIESRYTRTNETPDEVLATLGSVAPSLEFELEEEETPPVKKTEDNTEDDLED